MNVKPNRSERTMTSEVKTALRILADISSATALIPVVVGGLKFRRLDSGLKAITALCFVSIAIDLIGSFSTRENPLSLYTMRIFTFMEFTLISLFFLREASRKLLKQLLFITYFAFVGIQVTDIYFQGIVGYDDLSIASESVLVIVYSLVTLYFIMMDMQYPNILATPQFWIITAILVYFAGNIFVFSTSNYALSLSPDASRFIWSMHSLIHVAFNILLAIGLWKVKTVSR